MPRAYQARASSSNGPDGSPSSAKQWSRIACWRSASCWRRYEPAGPTANVNGSQKSSKSAYLAEVASVPDCTSSSPAPRRSSAISPSRTPTRACSPSVSGWTVRAARQNVLSIVMPPPGTSHMQPATTPPGRVTRAISRTPAAASRMNATTSEHSATSNAPSSNGSSSATPTRTSAPGLRARQASANCSAGSIAATWSAPTRDASSRVSPPGPQPTSSARMPAATPAASASSTASCGT